MSYKIPLFDLNYGAEEIQALTDTIKDNWISIGPRCEKFEADFAAALHSPYALTVDNCTNALFMALMALDIGPGDEVLVPSLTFVATVNSVKYVGATPVFCDITSYENLCISPQEIEAKITPRTKAITVMHYAGFPCDMDAIMAIARKHNLKVIEDACHGPLSEYRSGEVSGKRLVVSGERIDSENYSVNSVNSVMKLGTIGDIGCFSFFSNKNISTGEGGMLTCKDEAVYKRLKLLRSHGMTTTSYQRAGGHSTKYDVVSLGYNFRMDDLRAALGIVQLAKLKDDLIKRAQVRSWYEEMLAGVPGIIVPFCSNQCSGDSVQLSSTPVKQLSSDQLSSKAVNSDQLSSKAVNSVQLSSKAVNSDQLSSKAVNSVQLSSKQCSTPAFVSNYIFPIMLTCGDADYRDGVRDRLHAAGVQTSVHYPASHRFSIYQSLNAKLPLTEYASDHLITLPMYSKLTQEDVAFVVTALRETLESI